VLDEREEGVLGGETAELSSVEDSSELESDVESGDSVFSTAVSASLSSLPTDVTLETSPVVSCLGDWLAAGKESVNLLGLLRRRSSSFLAP
jgi:hypothetical protein